MPTSLQIVVIPTPSAAEESATAQRLPTSAISKKQKIGTKTAKLMKVTLCDLCGGSPRPLRFKIFRSLNSA